MKKVLLAIGGLIGIFVVVFGAIMGSTFGGMKPMTDGEELPGGARRVTSSYTSAYVIPSGEKEVVLVDCNDDIDAKAIKAELTRRGLGVEAVKTILLTHGHPDHTGGCKQFTGAQVIIGDGEQGLVDGSVGSQGPLPKMMGKQPQFAIQGARPVKDGTLIDVGTLQVRAYVIPGHTAGSAAYLVNGELFVGDSLAFNSDGTVRPAPWIFSDDGATNVASIKRLGKLLAAENAEVKVIVPAHSGSVEGLKSLVDYSGT